MTKYIKLLRGNMSNMNMQHTFSILSSYISGYPIPSTKKRPSHPAMTGDTAEGMKSGTKFQR